MIPKQTSIVDPLRMETGFGLLIDRLSWNSRKKLQEWADVAIDLEEFLEADRSTEG